MIEVVFERGRDKNPNLTLTRVSLVGDKSLRTPNSYAHSGNLFHHSQTLLIMISPGLRINFGGLYLEYKL